MNTQSQEHFVDHKGNFILTNKIIRKNTTTNLDNPMLQRKHKLLSPFYNTFLGSARPL